MPFLLSWLAINADKSRLDASIAKKMLSLWSSSYLYILYCPLCCIIKSNLTIIVSILCMSPCVFWLILLRFYRYLLGFQAAI